MKMHYTVLMLSLLVSASIFGNESESDNATTEENSGTYILSKENTKIAMLMMSASVYVNLINCYLASMNASQTNLTPEQKVVHTAKTVFESAKAQLYLEQFATKAAENTTDTQVKNFIKKTVEQSKENATALISYMVQQNK